MYKIILFLRSCLFSVGMGVSVLLIGTLSLLFIKAPEKTKYRIVKLWPRFMMWWTQFSVGISYEIQGQENIPNGNVIVLSNHQSTWETFAYQALFPWQSTVLKKQLLSIPFFGWALRLQKPIAIDRNAPTSAGEQLIAQGQAHLQQGRWVVIFPQGTRSKPGIKHRFARGGAALAVASGYPILPMAHNAGLFWGRKKFIKRPGTIRIVIGELIDPKQYDSKVLNEKVKSWIESEAEKLFKH